MEVISIFLDIYSVSLHKLKIRLDSFIKVRNYYEYSQNFSKKLNNPEKLLKGRASVSFSDINGLLIRIFRRKKFIRIIYIHRCTWNRKRIEIHLKVTTLSDARKICEKRTDAIRNGRHPDYSGIQQTQLTFNDAIEAYKTKKSSSWSARTLNEFNNPKILQKVTLQHTLPHPPMSFSSDTEDRAS